jgi:hypothetical protein
MAGMKLKFHASKSESHSEKGEAGKTIAAFYETKCIGFESSGFV